MEAIDWIKEVAKRKEELIQDTQNLLRIKSVLDEENATSDAPLGPGVKEALSYMLELGEKDGFKAKTLKMSLGTWNSVKGKN